MLFYENRYSKMRSLNSIVHVFVKCVVLKDLSEPLNMLSKFQLILNNFSDFKLSCKNSTFNGLKFKKNKLEIDKVLRERCYISFFLALFKYVFQKTIPV